VRLVDKVALITGAGSGLGPHAAMLFAAHGARVVVADHSLARARDIEAQIDRTGGDALALAIDLTNEDDVADVVASTLDHYGRIDVLLIVGTLDVDREGSELALPCRYAAVAMREVRRGSVVVTSPSPMSHADSEGADSTRTARFVRTTAAAYRGDGIRVNGLCTGSVGTLSAGPLNLARRLQLRDYAHTALFFASNESIGVTGVWLAL
jgi:NAD(P)-dependent dehydrogenase (short-subunit alcohol dehydrogenase family)